MAENLSTLSSDGLAGTPTGTGARYQTMSAWESGQQSDLVTDGDNEVLECYSGFTSSYSPLAPTDALDDIVLFGAWITGPSNDITVRAAAGHKYDYKTQTGFTITNSTIDTTIRVGASASAGLAITFEDIHIGYYGANAGSSFADRAMYIDGLSGQTQGTKLKRCVLTGQGSGANACFRTERYTVVQAENTIFRCNPATDNDDAQDAVYLEFRNTSSLTTFVNCDFFSGEVVGSHALKVADITRTFGGMFSNCVLHGLGSGISTDATVTNIPVNTMENCAFSDTVNLGSDFVSNIDTTAYVDFANNDLTPATSGLLDGAGTTPPILSDDFDSNTRNDPDDIGAYAIAGSGPTPAVLSNHTTPAVDVTTATIGCTTDTAGGTLYWYLSQSNVAPTSEQLKAGTNAEQFNNFTPTLGANTVDLTGLTSSTEYWHYWIQETT